MSEKKKEKNKDFYGKVLNKAFMWCFLYFGFYIYAKCTAKQVSNKFR
jgi:hypothetical protein